MTLSTRSFKNRTQRAAKILSKSVLPLVVFNIFQPHYKMNVLHSVQTSSQDTRVFQQQVWSLLLGTLGWPVYRSQPFLQNALATQRTIECVIPPDIWTLLWLPISQLSMVSPNIWIQLIHIQKNHKGIFCDIDIILDTPPSSASACLSAPGLLPRLQKSPQSGDAGELSPENFHRAKSNRSKRMPCSFIETLQGARSEPTDPAFLEGKKGK